MAIEYFNTSTQFGWHNNLIPKLTILACLSDNTNQMVIIRNIISLDLTRNWVRYRVADGEKLVPFHNFILIHQDIEEDQLLINRTEELKKLYHKLFIQGSY